MIPKFRVAFKNNILGEVGSIDFVDETVTIPVYDKLDGDYLGDNVCGLNQVTLMQSTGLFDVNGKEIFEGDVVEVFDSRYTVFYDSENASFRLKPRDKRWNTDYMSNYAHEASFEIIGDVYQNPELVEEMK